MVLRERIEFYEKNLERVNYWLQFAEAKNAATIVFVVAILSLVFNLFINDIVMLLVLSTIFSIALTISISSMIPKGNMGAERKNGEYLANDNFIYWKDIAKYSKMDYVKTTNKLLFDDECSGDVERQELMLAEEIITNARIADFKYKRFRWASIVVIIGIIVIPFFLIAKIFLEQ